MKWVKVITFRWQRAVLMDSTTIYLRYYHHSTKTYSVTSRAYPPMTSRSLNLTHDFVAVARYRSVMLLLWPTPVSLIMLIVILMRVILLVGVVWGRWWGGRIGGATWGADLGSCGRGRRRHGRSGRHGRIVAVAPRRRRRGRLWIVITRW